MKSVKVFVEDIISFLGNQVIAVEGDVNGVFIDNLADVAHVNETTLDWIQSTKTNKQEIAEKSVARVILVDAEVKYSEEIKSHNKTLIVVENPKLALAAIGNTFFVQVRNSGIHPTALVDGKAVLGANVSIGAYSVIGRCVIGDNTRIDANVCIYDDVVIGDNCVVKSGVVIGGEGFGYEKDEHGNLFRFPQLGGVRIGNHVEIGSNTCIDRGALADTIIGDYTKINNLCHVAHNNKIGRNVVITAQVNVSGSNVIEDNVWIAPNSSIRGWLSIGENAVIGMGAVVVKNVPANETWVGCPAQKITYGNK